MESASFDPLKPDYQALLTLVVGSLVDRPEEVKVEVTEATHTVVFEVAVAPEDMKRIIGRGGCTTQALRQIMRTWSAREHRRLLLDVVEPLLP